MGCEPSMPTTKGMNYLCRKPLELPVKSIQICMAPEADTACPKTTSVSLLDVVQQWAREHLAASGTAGVLKITIVNAFVKEIPLRSNAGVKGFWTIENTEKYCGQVHINFEYGSNISVKYMNKINVSVSGEKYAAENYRIPERRSLLIALYEDLINRLNFEVDKALPSLFES